MNNFYIYIYLDPRKSGRYLYDNFSFLFEPIYIGKGKNGRYKKIDGRKKDFIEIINEIKKSGLEPIAFKLYENLNEEESFELERKLIKEIGRIKLKTGTLINKTSGGQGISGYKYKKETRELIAKKQRKDFQIIKNEFEKRRYVLLTEEKEYKNANQKLKYICNKEHNNNISWSHFKQGQKCHICEDESKRKNFLYIKREFENRNYKLLTEEKEYKNNKQKLNYICPNGHSGSIIWNSFQQKKNCPICYNESKSERSKGEYNSNSILIIQDIIQIKLLLKEGKLIQKEIANIFEVSVATISAIKNKRNWAHIKLGDGYENNIR